MTGSFRVVCGLITLGAAGAAASDFQGGAGDFKWRFSANAFTRTLPGTSFKPGSRTTQQDVPGVPQGIQGPRADIGPAGGPFDRTYDDGWIVDEGRFVIGNDRKPIPVTSDWGVADSSQVEAGRASFSVADGVQSTEQGSRTEATGGSASGTGHSSAWGGAIEAELLYRQGSNICWGVLFNYSELGQSEGLQTSSFQNEQAWRDSDRTITDTFDVQGGLLINQPVRRDVRDSDAGGHVQRTYNVVEQELDFELNTFSLGVSRERRWGRFFVQGAVGPTLNLVSSDATRTETLLVSRDGGPSRVLREWRDVDSDDEVLFGGFAQGSARYRLSRYLQAGIIARFDRAQSAKGAVGPASYETDLNGFTLAVTLGREW